ncbi:MAG: MBL fold metallo-hydrolase [bacterium]|nr:MBL fold metallo-hydrolase [bacterium]
MKFRIFPLWWPLLIILSPVIIPLLIIKNRSYKKNLTVAEESNKERVQRSKVLDLPELDSLELTVLVEEKTEEGFLNDPGVSYFLKTNQGSMLYDLGFGPDNQVLEHNAAKLDFSLDSTDALTISHLHPDHMGGKKAWRTNKVRVPEKLGSPRGKACYIPAPGVAEGFKTELITEPKILPGGIGTTGPLARSLFFFGFTEEQALVARVKGKGLIIFTACGHPTIERILEMVQTMSTEPVYAIAGGFHFPVSQGRGNYGGIQVQTIIGTGLPPWQRISEKDMTRSIMAINKAAPEHVYLSAHDSCDMALKQFTNKLNSRTEILKAGATYRF